MEEKIQLCDWETILSGKETYILSVGFSRENEFGLGIENSHFYTIPNSHFQNPFFTELLVRVFVPETEEVYRIKFSNVGAFRVIDEHGLQEIIQEIYLQKVTTVPTIKSRNHGWVKESPASFFMGCKDGWSFLIITGWDCLEVLTVSEPVFELEGKAIKQDGTLPNELLN